MAKVSPLEPRFNASYSVADNGCWIWIRGRTAAGYGQITHINVEKLGGIYENQC